jgi:hypothetical protein
MTGGIMDTSNHGRYRVVDLRWVVMMVSATMIMEAVWVVVGVADEMGVVWKTKFRRWRLCGGREDEDEDEEKHEEA